MLLASSIHHRVSESTENTEGNRAWETGGDLVWTGAGARAGLRPRCAVNWGGRRIGRWSRVGSIARLYSLRLRGGDARGRLSGAAVSRPGGCAGRGGAGTNTPSHGGIRPPSRRRRRTKAAASG